MRTVELFSGAGLAAHGLSRAGLEHVAFAEIDRHASAVLAKRWPDVPNLGDVTRMGELPACDVLWASPPCTPFSVAGKRDSIKDKRDLWPHVADVILELPRPRRPPIVIVENVPGMLTARGDPFGRILADLRSLDYGSVEWDHLPACALGQMHRRDRVFLVARRDGLATWPDAEECSQQALVPGVIAGKWPRAGRWDGSLHVRRARWPVVDGPLWPTPKASDAFTPNKPERVAIASASGVAGVRNLREDVHAHAWPTPRTGDAKQGPSSTAPHVAHGDIMLSDAVKLWATPAARDWKSGDCSPELYARNERPLNEQVAASGYGFLVKAQLNPDWAEALMGAPVGLTDLDCDTPRELQGVVAPRLVGPHGEPLPSPQHEWEPPRVTTRREQRRARLRAVGNGVDVRCAEAIGAAVMASVGVRT